MPKDVSFINLNKPYFATDFTHSLLSSCAYKTHEKNDKLEFVKEQKLKYNDHLKNWYVEEVFSPSKSDDYYSALYLNPVDGHAVLAHRGTDIKGSIVGFNQSLKEDMIEILNKNIGIQQIAAYSAVKTSLEILKEKNQNSDHNYHFSLTGHSLGAWLAELSLFFCHADFGYSNVKAVTFDSPGSYDHLENFRSNIISDKTFLDHNFLDLTTYLSAPNLVNVCNRHFGQVYRIYPEIADPRDKIQEMIKEPPKQLAMVSKLYGKFKHALEPTKLILDLVDSNKHYAYAFLSVAGHSLDPIIEVFDEKTGLPVKYREMVDWPLLNHEDSGGICAGEVGLVKIGSEIASSVGIPDIVVQPASKLIAKLVPALTSSSVMNVIAEFISGNIELVQICESFKYLENGSQGYREITPANSYDKFNMSYQAHYKTLETDLYKAVMSRFIKGTPEWYLKQILKTNIAELQDLPDQIKNALSELKKNYKIEFKNGQQSIVSTHPYTINSLKDNVRLLIEQDNSLEQTLAQANWMNSVTLKNDSVVESVQSRMLSDLPTRVKGFVMKKDIFNKIDGVLYENKIASISAFAGTGKSSIATEYGHLFDKKEDSIVFWIPSETEDKVNKFYRNLALKFDIDSNQYIVSSPEQSNEEVLDNELLAKLVGEKIVSSANHVLFIFDNVEKYSDIEKHLSSLEKFPVKILITTRDRNLLNHEDLNIELEPFSESDSIHYVEKNLGNRLDKQQAKDLISFLGSRDNMVLPHKLSKAVTFLKEKKFWRVSQYIKHRKENPGQDEDNMLFEQVANTNENAWKILQYGALLDPDFIDLEILSDLLSINLGDLQDAIRDLEKLSLVNLVYNKDRIGIQIQRVVQDDINQCFLLKNIPTAEKEDLAANLKALFVGSMPWVECKPDEKWDIAGSLYPHIRQLMQEYSEMGVSEEIATFFSKLAEYSRLVSGEYEQTLDYYKKDLDIRLSLYKGMNHPDLAIALNNVGCSYESLGEYGKALDYKKRALQVTEKLYGKNNLEIAQSLNNIGNDYANNLGDYESALVCYKQSLNIREGLLPADHSLVIQSLNNIRYVCNSLKEEYSAYEHKAKYYSVIPEAINTKCDNSDTLLIKSKNIFINCDSQDEVSILKKPEICKSLNGIAKASEKGNWTSGYFISRATSLLGDWGVKGYVDSEYLNKVLGEDSSDTKNIEILKMLCFEAICLGIWSQPEKAKDYKCLDEFVELYPDIVDKVLELHPEYFVNKYTLGYCIKYSDNQVNFSDLMQSKINQSFFVDDENSIVRDSEEKSFIGVLGEAVVE